MTLEEVVFSFSKENISRLPSVYKWRIPTTFPGGNITSSSVSATDSKKLKESLHTAWGHANVKDKAKLESWYVVVFGGVRSNNPKTLANYSSKSTHDLVQLGRKGIASWSKMLCVRDPSKYLIFDARVAVSLNSLLYSNGLLAQGMFPVLASQNKKIKQANKILREIKPRPPERHDFYNEYCDLLKLVAGKLSTSEAPVSAMDLEMLLFAQAEDLVTNHLTKVKTSKTVAGGGTQQGRTLSRHRPFSYTGSPATGTTITYGNGFTAHIDQSEYAQLRAHFRGKDVVIGTSRTNAPPGSLGAWINEHLANRPVLTSYVAPILIQAGWAEMIDPKTIRFS